METLHVQRLTAGYGDTPAVLRGVDLDVGAGEVVALLGESGSGKSTLLRCVAGLHPLREGRVLIGGRDVHAVPVEQRGIGLVFQDHALFPHRDVAGNVAFGPRMQGLDRPTITQRVDEALMSVGILGLRDRAVDELSGGEQQRVALARAIAAEPHLLLLDEPYGSLDRPLRERLIAELPGLVRGTARGALLVTHDQQEALRVADRIAVLVDGVLHQLDTPERIWSDPASAAVAAFLDIGPVLDAEVSDGVAHGTFGALHLPGTPDGPGRMLLPRTALEIQDAAQRTGHERLDPTARSASARLPASLVGVRFSGDHHRIEVALEDGTHVSVRSAHRPCVTEPGAALLLTVDTDAVRLYPGTTAPDPHPDGRRAGDAGQ